ncbi:hypothetical protein A9Q99_11405 [Gammaproteobacteria bacterium 45_16_T64]|nr:hypothetical protein A9Q99_11405 [Gammaproteobacteria bacterium 45_16_T64]
MRTNVLGALVVGLGALYGVQASVVYANHDDKIESKPKSLLETVIVTATREERSLATTAASIGVLDEVEVQDVNPTHASELLNSIPGVNIVQLGSSAEGTAAAIRQPISYGPVYLYLENGVPTRSAGFFNHNALYGMNVTQASGVEVIKGPGSALYGSDAIGAVINLISGRPPTESQSSIGVEVGEDGWRRAQIRSDHAGTYNGFTARLDVSEYAGWREHTDSERQSFTGSWNTVIGSDIKINTVFSATNLEYNTGGSGLTYDDYRNDPERAGNLVAYREATAYRLSTAFEKELKNGSLTITPFLRSNDLEYVAHWKLNIGRPSPEAHINESGHDSAGVLIKHSFDITENSLLISGVDVDYTRGYVNQTLIARTDTDPGDYWLSFEEQGDIYDFDVDYYSVSPYAHFEYQATDKLRVSAGLRFDSVHYDYENNLTVDVDGDLKRLPDEKASFSHWSPKLSAIYQFTSNINGFAAYRHAFRVPSAGQMYRSGKTADSSDLDPVKVDSIEFGLRGDLNENISFESSIYYMTKKDDIFSVKDDDGLTRNVNAGETAHYGIELGSEAQLSDTVSLIVAYTRTIHRYTDWKDGSDDYDGNYIPLAPEDFANTRLRYRPALLNGGKLEAEWIHQGAHWIDQDNDDSTRDPNKYDGHDLLNLRADYWATDRLNLYVRVLNATDKRYAETTSSYGKYNPGRPRTAFLGFRVEL